MNNIYIENHAVIAGLGKRDDIGVALDIFDAQHQLEHNDLARAQYKQKYCPVNLSPRERQLLEG